MKKIFVTTLGIIIIAAASAQNSPAGHGAKTMTVAEANALNGVAQPTTNGKPYNQYKAEQDAQKLKQQKEAAAAAKQLPVTLSILKTKANTGPVIPAAPKAADKQKTPPGSTDDIQLKKD